MIVRPLLLSLVAASLVCFPAWASQPSGSVAKLISNPPITPPPSDNGLPQVTCFGFAWAQAFSPRQLDPTDTVSLEMAIIPFRSGSTNVYVANLMQLRFADGMVSGLPYRRSAWNDVKVLARPATHDYLVTVNGAQAGPFQNEFTCEPTVDCLKMAALSIRGNVLEESVGWIDSLSLVRNTVDGPDVALTDDFDQCYESQNAYLGGLLIVAPPQNLNAGGPR